MPYRGIVTSCGRHGKPIDPVTENLAVTVLSDGEAHRAEFRGFRKEYVYD
jgi:bacterioferritin